MIRVERGGPVATVCIDRPERKNAIDRDHAEQLAQAFRDLDADDAVSVAILTGAGATFSAGADLKAVAEGAPNRVALDGDGPLGPTRLVLSKPVIAAIEGYAVAGGLELALWCDLRVMAEDATLGVFCRRFGVPLIDGGTVRLPRLIGLSRALDLILSGRPVSAQEAHQMGLVNRLAPPGQSLLIAEQWAHTLAKFPQACLRADLASARAAFDTSLSESIQQELLRGAQVIGTESIAGAMNFVAGKGRHGEFS